MPVRENPFLNLLKAELWPLVATDLAGGGILREEAGAWCRRRERWRPVLRGGVGVMPASTKVGSVHPTSAVPRPVPAVAAA